MSEIHKTKLVYATMRINKIEVIFYIYLMKNNLWLYHVHISKKQV